MVSSRGSMTWFKGQISREEPGLKFCEPELRRKDPYYGGVILVCPCGKEVSARTLLQGARPRASINQIFSNLFNSFVQPLRAPRARRASAPLRPASGASVYKSVRSIPPFAIDLRAPFAARLEARAPRRRCALTPESCQLVPAQRPTDASCARGRQICSQHSLHLPSTGALLSPRALTRSRCGGDELGLHAGPVGARTAAPRDGCLARARMQQHGSMALSARVLCRCGGNGADASRRATQPTPNVVPRPAA